MKQRAVFGLISFLLSTLSWANSSSLYEITVDNQRRSYKLFVPTPLETKSPALMVVFHGGLGNADETESTTQMNTVAQQHGFIVAYPNGTALKLMPKRRTWNAGQCCGPAAKEQVNDVAFIEAMLSDIQRHQRYDAKRTYLSGISNGAMMAYRLACERPEQIAAIVPVAGTLAINQCSGAGRIAVLHIHGSDDSNVPYAGGQGKNSLAGVQHRSIESTLALISGSAQCAAAHTPQDLGDGSRLSQWHCLNRPPVMLRLIARGEHVWPGGKSRRNNRLYSGNFSASEAAWEFAQHFSQAD